MKRFLKKIFNKITLSLSIAMITICSLFAMTRTYAYDYNSNTNQLVGNNIIDSLTYSNATYYNSSNGVINMPTQISVNNNIITYNLNGTSFDTGYVNVFFNKNNFQFTSSNYNIVVLVETNNLSGSVGSGSYNYRIEWGFGGTNDNTGQFGWGTENNQTYWYYEGTHSNIFTSITNNVYNNNSYYGFKFRLGNSGNANFSLNGTIKVSFFVFDNHFNSNYLINNNQTFVPYSSVEELQQDYNTLLGQYNELQTTYENYQSTHSYTNIQYNNLISQINNLEAQYVGLQLQYSVYVSTHSHTDEEYNTLNTQYQTLQTNYTTLQNNYELLQSQYNDLLNNYNSLRSSTFSGWWYFIERVDVYASDVFNESYTFDYLFSNGFIDNFDFKITDFTTSLNIDAVDCHFDIYFTPKTILLKDFVLSYYDDELWRYIPYYYLYDYIDNQSYSVSTGLDYIDERALYQVANNVVLTDEQWNNIVNDSRNDSWRYNTFIEQIAFEVQVESDMYNMTAVVNNTIDTISFQNGYKSGYSTAYSEYLNVQNENINLRNQIADVRNENISLSTAYNSLQSSYNSLLSGNNFTSLFFTIAETPFASFKQIWNVDFLGVNLSGFVTGLLFIGLMIWLVKKIF